MDRESAIRAFRRVLGASNVADDAAHIERYARTTLDAGTRPECILYPESTAQVQDVVKIAVETRMPLYPISRGRNWGYGDACAPVSGTAIVDLSRMNKIIEVNAELGYAVIEAGVSQQQLYTHLRERGYRLWLDASGAGYEASLVGNTLDRGFGHTRYGDHFLTSCGMEIVLADGRILNTGFGHYAEARAARVYRYGAGPFLDGLFCQSNLGIVTRIGLWLMPEPEAFTFFFVKVDRDELLGPLVDRLRVLRMAGLLQSAIHIGNDLRILSGTGRYPWKEAGGVTPLPEEVRRKYREAAGIGAWSAAGSITGTVGTVRAARRALRKELAGTGKLVFVDDCKLALGQFAAKCLGYVGLGGRLRRQLEALVPNYELLKGIPTNEPLLGPQWRLRHPPSGVCDPLDAGCGTFWISPVLPATRADAERVLSIVAPVYAGFEFELLVTFTLITERAMICIMNVAFDKSLPEETARARSCYDAVSDALIGAGYYPYRATLRGMSKLVTPGDTFWEVARQVKSALDPAGIIAPGRYIPE